MGIFRKVVIFQSTLNAFGRISRLCRLHYSSGSKKGKMAMPLRIPFTPDFFLRQLFDPVSSTYTYLLADLNGLAAVIIDPVLDHAKRDAQLIKELGFCLKTAMNTHLHADHITGTGVLKAIFPNVRSAISLKSGAKADLQLKDGQIVQCGRHEIQAISTPGHTNGCMCFIVHEQGIIFTGDTILIRGCGRTDFQEGSANNLYDSVHKKIFTLPENFRIFPSHDYKGQMESSVYEEKLYNRFTKSREEFIKIMDNMNLPKPKQIDKALPGNLVCGIHDLLDAD